MDIQKALKRIMPLRRLARDQVGTPEGETALKQAKFFEEKYNIEIPDDAFEAASHEFETGYIWDEILLEILADMLELAYSRKNERIVLEGPKFALDEAVEAFEFHRDIIERIAISSALSYMGAAVPGFGDALIGIINRNRERARKQADVEDSADPDAKGRYTSAKIMERVFRPDSVPSQQKIIDLMRSIGSRNVRPFWEKFKGE